MSTSLRNRRAVRFEIPSSCDRDALSCGSITWKIRAELGEPEDSPAVSSSSSSSSSSSISSSSAALGSASVGASTAVAYSASAS